MWWRTFSWQYLQTELSYYGSPSPTKLLLFIFYYLYQNVTENAWSLNLPFSSWWLWWSCDIIIFTHLKISILQIHLFSFSFCLLKQYSYITAESYCRKNAFGGSVEANDFSHEIVLLNWLTEVRNSFFFFIILSVLIRSGGWPTGRRQQCSWDPPASQRAISLVSEVMIRYPHLIWVSLEQLWNICIVISCSRSYHKMFLSFQPSASYPL